MTHHKWTVADDAALRVAVEACLPLQAVMKGNREVWWAAVCGRMGLPDVSPDAARTRWERLCREATSSGPPSAREWHPLLPARTSRTRAMSPRRRR
jgi:hypothetical protein